MLAGFFCNNARKEDLNGFYINKVNPDDGTLLLSSFKEIKLAMLGKSYEDAGDEDEEIKEGNKRAKKEQRG